MCGRYTHLYTWKQLHRLMGLMTPIPDEQLPLRYNVTPMTWAPVVHMEPDGGRRVEMFRWGLVSSRVTPEILANPRNGVGRTINARSETAATSPAFRAAMRSGRCLVPVSGFYEWQTLPGVMRKQPWYITPADGEIFALAGLWEEHRNLEGEAVRTFAILTTTPNAAIAPIHDRMPVILSPIQFGAWFDPVTKDPAKLAPLLAPCPPERVRLQRVGTFVNSGGHDDPRCIEPVGPSSLEQLGLFG